MRDSATPGEDFLEEFHAGMLDERKLVLSPAGGCECGEGEYVSLVVRRVHWRAGLDQSEDGDGAHSDKMLVCPVGREQMTAAVPWGGRGADLFGWKCRCLECSRDGRRVVGLTG